jgi:hypothetical protein
MSRVSSLGSCLKSALIFLIVILTLVHTVLMTIAMAPIVGMCGLFMQLIYSRFIDDFPFVKIRSPRFIMACGISLPFTNFVYILRRDLHFTPHRSKISFSSWNILAAVPVDLSCAKANIWTGCAPCNLCMDAATSFSRVPCT